MKYLIDTDPGHDDAMAIMLALKARLDVIAITTVSGNSSIQNTTRNARYILKMLRREYIPVYSGASQPLKGKIVRASVHGKSGLEGINPTNAAHLTGNATHKIIDAAEKEKNLTIIALGPLTNIAAAIKKEPKIISRVKHLIIMGGAINVPGNKTRVAEFNIYSDPEAADIVFRHNVKKTIVPLDSCRKVTMTISDFKKIKGPIGKTIRKMARPHINLTNKHDGVNAMIMYDPLTVYYALKPSSCRTRDMDLLVETKGIITRDMTVAEQRAGKKKEYNVKVVLDVNTAEFKKDFIRHLNKSM